MQRMSQLMRQQDLCCKMDCKFICTNSIDSYQGLKFADFCRCLRDLALAKEETVPLRLQSEFEKQRHEAPLLSCAIYFTCVRFPHVFVLMAWNASPSKV